MAKSRRDTIAAEALGAGAVGGATLVGGLALRGAGFGLTGGLLAAGAVAGLAVTAVDKGTAYKQELDAEAIGEHAEETNVNSNMGRTKLSNPVLQAPAQAAAAMYSRKKKA